MSKTDLSMLHRGCFVAVLDSENRIFIHQRQENMVTYPLHWDLFVGGFVSSGEDYEESAKRELEEETGIKGKQLEFIAKFKHDKNADNFFGALYKIKTNKKIIIQESEIKQSMFIDLDKVDKSIENRHHPS